MIKRIGEEQIYPGLFDDCFRMNLQKKDRVYFYFEEKEKYFQELSYLIALEPFFVCVDETDEINGVAFLAPVSEGPYPIKGLWGSRRVKEELLAAILQEFPAKQFYVTIEKANHELIEVVKSNHFTLWESAVVLSKVGMIDTSSLSPVCLVPIHRSNFELARAFAERYFQDYYWNVHRLFEHIDKRDLLLFKRGEEIVGIVQGVVLENDEAEIFAVIPFDDSDFVELVVRYTNYLLEKAKKVKYFLDEERRGSLDDLLKVGFEMESETETYLMNL